MQRKKILVLTSTFPRWPGDTTPPFVHELSKRLTKSFEITVLAPHYPGSPIREERDGMAIRRFRYSWGRFETLAGEKAMLPALRGNRLNYLLVPFFLLAEFFATLYLVRRSRIDCIHAHWLLPQGLIAALVKLIAGVPFVVTAHGGDVYGLRGWLPTILKSFTLRQAARVTTVSRDLATRVDELVPGLNISVIPMGVDSTAFHPAFVDPTIRQRHGIAGEFLLFVGRLSEKKGVRYLFEAMPRVVERFPGVKLMVIGKGELEEELHGLVSRLALTDQVVFTGAIPNHELPAYYATADVFVGPSIISSGGDTEGFGLTFVEAGLSGCLVIGTRTGGIGDIIEDGKTGFLVEMRDAEALAEAIINGLALQAESRGFGESVRQRLMGKFDWQIIAGKYGALLEGI